PEEDEDSRNVPDVRRLDDPIADYRESADERHGAREPEDVAPQVAAPALAALRELALVLTLEAGLVHQLVVQRRPHWNSRSRGLPRSAFWSSSIASRSRFVSFFGTEIRTRASTSPRPEPLSFGAPRPRIRSS